MDPSNLCRLCVDICQGGKSLYDENGRTNELYEITFKYFHPTIVNMDDARHLTSICRYCWRLISEFNSFQTSIVTAQQKLLAAKEEVVKRSKEEEEPEYTDIVVKEERDLDMLPGFTDYNYVASETGNAEIENQTIHISRPKLEIMDVEQDSDCSSDAEISHLYPSQSLEGYTISSVAEVDTNQKRRQYQRLNDLLAQWMPVIKCDLCPASYSNMSSLQEHFVQQHPNEEFYISCCSRKLNKRVHIKEHIMLHYDPYAFKCELCSKSYATKKSLRRHVALRHPETECIKFLCRICGKGLKTKGGLKLHYISLHNTEPPAEEGEEDLGNTKKRKRAKKIKQSGILIQNKDELRGSNTHNSPVHMKLPSLRLNELKYQANHNSEIPPEQLILPHETLQLTTTIKSELPPPEESHSPDRKINHYTIVPKIELQSDESLESTLNPTSAKMPPEQIIPPSSAAESLHCVRHEPKLNCSVCGRSFKRSRDLLEHVATHEKRDLYACAFCPQTFRKLNRVSHHRKLEHPEESNKKFYTKINEKTLDKTKKIGGMAYYCAE